MQRLLNFKRVWAGRAWIGYDDMETEGTFEWLSRDGDDIAFTGWSNNQPDNHGAGEDCGEMYAVDALWKDRPCSDRQEFVCQVPREDNGLPLVCDSDELANVDPDFDVTFPSNRASFLQVGKFAGMPASPGIVDLTHVDPFFGQYRFEIHLDEVELRTKAGKLRGTVGIEHTVDTFLGLSNFRPTGLNVLDTFAMQVAIHLEKTSFFSVSTHGVNDYTFLEYVNLRLVTVYEQDTDFSDGSGEVSQDLIATSSSLSADYIQVTFTLSSQIDINQNSGLIPLDSVRVGKGTFLDDVNLDPSANGMVHKCTDYNTPRVNTTLFPALPEWAFDQKPTFDARMSQDCSPSAPMCTSPSSIPDHFVSFNIPLGMDYFPITKNDLSNNIFVDMVVSATVLPAFRDSSAFNEGGDPTQMKTTLTASIPVVEGGINIFCDGLVSKTDLKDVSNADIVVGSASSLEELSRLRIKKDIASTQLDPSQVTEINSDSIEAGLMTLILKGNHSYFKANSGINTAGVSLELEDVMTIHIMESGTGDGSSGQNQPASKLEQVALLLADQPDDNSFSSGLDTNGYALNGAFFFTFDRSSQRAHLEPSPELLDLCPFNPTRPSSTNTEIETCITRRDVRYRNYPHRTGSTSTAMEICAKLVGNQGAECLGADGGSGASCCDVAGYASEKEFMYTIFGESDYSEQLAEDYTRVLANEYDLNQRYRRAYWINPGYEWTPTQTGGNSIFTISQFLYMFALVTLDEGVSSDGGESLAQAGPTFTRRRMLLQATSDNLKDAQASMGGDLFSFDITPESMMAKAFEVAPEKVATFAVSFQLTEAEACQDMRTLQNSLRITLEDYAKNYISEYHTLQVTTLSVDLGDLVCARRRVRQLLSAFSSATADATMLVVFKESSPSQININAISQLPAINSIQPLVVLTDVVVDAPILTPAPGETPSTSSSSSTTDIGLIAGIAGGVGGALLAGVGGIGVMMTRSRNRDNDVAVGSEVQAINIADLKASLADEV